MVEKLLTGEEGGGGVEKSVTSESFLLGTTVFSKLGSFRSEEEESRLFRSWVNDSDNEF